jgi:hypothetical protein
MRGDDMTSDAILAAAARLENECDLHGESDAFTADLRALIAAVRAASPAPTHYAFLIKRPRDREAWPTIFTDRERAEAYPNRASPVVPIRFTDDTPPLTSEDRA